MSFHYSKALIINSVILINIRTESIYMCICKRSDCCILTLLCASIFLNISFLYNLFTFPDVVLMLITNNPDNKKGAHGRDNILPEFLLTLGPKESEGRLCIFNAGFRSTTCPRFGSTQSLYRY